MFSTPISITPTAQTVHKLRESHAGISYLKQTGRFRDYMTKRVTTKQLPFLAWDGEGWNLNEFEHKYMLLQNSKGERITGPQLTTIHCLEFIIRTAAKYPKHIHVIYGGGYDAAHILRDLPLEQTAKLKDNNPIYVDVPRTPSQNRNTFTIHYLPHKWMQIRGFDWVTRTWVQCKIFDVMTFFQTSFIKALESRHITVADEITSGKANRSNFTYDDLEEVSLYCQMELEATVMLCNELRDEFNEAQIHITQWHGPGAVANAVYKHNGVREHMGVTSPHIEHAAQLAYFGGHFEQFRAGHYNGHVYLYDINSAYPFHIAQLPSLLGARWEYVTEYDASRIGIWECSYDDTRNIYSAPHPLPWRSITGEVGFPAHNTRVWVYTGEAQYATTVYGGWVIVLDNDIKPFAFVPDMYRTRREWQKLGNGGERALKLALNSLYGKQAQRIGGRPEHGGKPPWHKLEWAGMVTSGTRTQILEAIYQKPETVISVETDSIMTTEPLDLPIGTELGQWELTEYEWVTYLQSGIYFTSDGIGKSKAKTRGIDTTQLTHDEVMHWLEGDQHEPLLVNSRNFIGLGNPRTYLYGNWQDSTKEIKIAGQKRLHAPNMCDACAQGMTLADGLHTLIAAPHYGIEPSQAHALPWIDGGVQLDNDAPHYVGDAIEEYQ